MAARITFRQITSADLPVMAGWLARPHVATWWDDRSSLDEVTEDFGPSAAPPFRRPLDAPKGTVPYFAYDGEQVIGYIQAYKVMVDHGEGWWPDADDPGALGIDQFLCDGDRLGQGLGSRMVRDFLAFQWEDPRVTRIQTDPSPANGRAIAAYRKAGFVDAGVIDTPDGPALLMRAARPPMPRPVGGKWYTCDFCGYQMLDLHCKLRCEQCGFIRDCSDP